MIGKIYCPVCKNTHDIDLGINIDNLLDECTNSVDWTRCIFRCVEFPDIPDVPVHRNYTIDDTRAAVTKLESSILNNIIHFENEYGVTVQCVDINCKPTHSKEQVKTKTLMIYFDSN